VEPDYLPDSEVFYFQPCLYPMKYLHPRSMYTLPRGECRGGYILLAGGSRGKWPPNIPRRKNFLVNVYCNFIVNLDRSL
jgi:hypothetical protein